MRNWKMKFRINLFKWMCRVLGFVCDETNDFPLYDFDDFTDEELDIVRKRFPFWGIAKKKFSATKKAQSKDPIETCTIYHFEKKV